MRRDEKAGVKGELGLQRWGGGGFGGWERRRSPGTTEDVDSGGMHAGSELHSQHLTLSDLINQYEGMMSMSQNVLFAKVS